MPSTSIVCGGLLILIGILGFLAGLMTTDSGAGRIVTALIPAGIGIILVALGVAARQFESWRKHLMHAAVVVALLGFIAVAAEIFRKIDALSYSASSVSKVTTALVCLLFVILAVRSFAEARRNREPV